LLGPHRYGSHEQDPGIDLRARLVWQDIEPLPDEIDTPPVQEVVERPHSYSNSGNPEKQHFSIRFILREILKLGIPMKTKGQYSPIATMAMLTVAKD
jgi:hypothetical protein